MVSGGSSLPFSTVLQREQNSSLLESFLESACNGPVYVLCHPSLWLRLGSSRYDDWSTCLANMGQENRDGQHKTHGERSAS